MRDGAALSSGTRVELEQWGGPKPLEARVRLVEPAAFTKISAVLFEVPAIAAPLFAAIATDTGTSASDGVTNDHTLVVSGTAEANSTVTIYDGGPSLGTATASGAAN